MAGANKVGKGFPFNGLHGNTSRANVLTKRSLTHEMSRLRSISFYFKE
jgi:hypothetical protein